MPFIPAPVGTVRAVYFFSLQGQECLVVHYFDVGTANPTGAELLAFADDLFAAMQFTFLPELSNEVSFQKVVVTAVQTTGLPQAQSTIGAAAGGVAQPAVSNALGILIALNTGLSGRSFRGRSFFPGGRDDEIAADSNYWGSTYISDLQSAAESYLATVNGLTPVGSQPNVWVVTSYYELDPLAVPPAPRSVPRATAINTPIISVAMRARIATQRRRRPRS